MIFSLTLRCGRPRRHLSAPDLWVTGDRSRGFRKTAKFARRFPPEIVSACFPGISIRLVPPAHVLRGLYQGPPGLSQIVRAILNTAGMWLMWVLHELAAPRDVRRRVLVPVHLENPRTTTSSTGRAMFDGVEIRFRLLWARPQSDIAHAAG